MGEVKLSHENWKFVLFRWSALDWKTPQSHMSLLTVVRHGQASFLAENYDKLSPLGEMQSRLLGEYWLAAGVEFDQVYYGPAERQIRTGEIVGDLFRKASRRWPEPAMMPEFDEYPAETIVKTFLPGLMQTYPELARAVEELRTTEDFHAKQRMFDRVLREVSQRWLEGEVGAPEIPTWQDFCHRIEVCIRKIVGKAAKSSSVVVFTSGGPTAAAVRAALGLSYRNTLDLTWTTRNTALTEFLFSGERFSLSSYNGTPHLTDRAQLTYR